MRLVLNMSLSDILSYDAACSFAEEAIGISYNNKENIVSGKIYAVSTEMYAGFMGNLKFDGKRILTVGSSGDQVFEYAFRGCRDITVMDANPLTPFFIELKYAALKSLDYRDFKRFFTKESFMALDIYISIRDNIRDKKVQDFWDYIFSKPQGQINSLFQRLDDITTPSYLKNKENYERTKQLIDSVNVKFYCTDIGDFYKYTDGEYDLIDLSNIYNWCATSGSEGAISNYWDAVNKLHNSLSVNGMLKISFGFYSGNFDYLKFMGKPARAIPYFDSRMAVAVWDNDPERYQQRKTLCSMSGTNSESDRMGGR